LITRSNLSFGPIAAIAFDDNVAAATDPLKDRKWRRDTTDILAPPASSLLPLLVDDASATAFPQANPISAAFAAVPAC